MRPAQARAFTLVEVVLAISLTLGLVGAALSFNHYVQAVKRDVVADVDATMGQQRAMELMTCELRCAFVGLLETDPTSFWGSGQEVDFLSTTLPGAAAWLAPEQHSAQMPPQSDVQRVTYRIRYGQTDDGAAVVEGLERVSLSVTPAAGDAESPSPAQIDLVAPSVRFVRFRYHVGDTSSGEFSGVTDNGWVDDWLGGPPLAVEITMGRNPLADGQDVYEYLAGNETFRRVVYLPGTTLDPLGSAGGGELQ